MSHDSFAQALAKVAVAQVAEIAGFDGIQEGAAYAMADVLLRYIREIGLLSHQQAEMARRTDTNVHDMVGAFEELGISVNDLESALGEPEVPFPYCVPTFPLPAGPLRPASFQTKGEQPPPYIQDFLPAFPDKHTYGDTELFPGHETDPVAAQQAFVQAKQQQEEALIKLEERQQATLQVGTSTGRQPNPYLADAEVVLEEEDEELQEALLQWPPHQPSAGPSAGPGAADSAGGMAGSAGAVQLGVRSSVAVDTIAPALEAAVTDDRQRAGPSWQATDEPVKAADVSFGLPWDWSSNIRQRAERLAPIRQPRDAFQDAYEETQRHVGMHGLHAKRKRGGVKGSRGGGLAGDVAIDDMHIAKQMLEDAARPPVAAAQHGQHGMHDVNRATAMLDADTVERM